MIDFNFLTLVSCVILYAAWRLSLLLFQRFIARSPLDNIPGPSGKSFLIGALPKLFGFKAWGFHQELARIYGGVARIRGLLGADFLYVYDPLALHHILLKDQGNYAPEPSLLQGGQLLFGDGLLGIWGEAHKKQRKMLNPSFSTANMRDLVPLFYNISQKTAKAFAKKVEGGPQEIDVLSWSTRTALELIAQSGLGTSFDPLTEGAAIHPYVNAAKRIVLVVGGIQLFRVYMLPIVMKIGTPKFRRVLLEWTPSKALQEAREIADLMHDTSAKVYQSKKKALAEGDEALKDQIAEGKDLISILMRNNMGASKGDGLSEYEVISQMSTLTFAATDTTSSAISRTLWQLSQRHDVQDKLRAELREAMSGRDALSYEEIVELKYLDAVCRELLRLYPPIPTMFRIAEKDTILPLHTPLTGIDGHPINEVSVPKGTKICLSVFILNRNKDLWGPDADDFKPERWLSELPDSVTSARIPGIYSNMMTFSAGGRSCIGFKFAELEMKVVLSLLVRGFRFSPSPDKEIYWNMTGIVTAGVIGDHESSPTRLPLVVELAK
ncbi:cytochrome P450 [Crepidotus variabilis]|uniref:Cytochrome P450 n=1 Tax=Crepidotus variabilis TaxID=179855 RepID=A0A9P6JNK5_9AGAR|nr:cytochrome P450 [Crepidotus variabilis]